MLDLWEILKTMRGLERHAENHRTKHITEIMDIASWHNLIKTSVDKTLDEDLQSEEILQVLKAFTVKSEHNCERA